MKSIRTIMLTAAAVAAACISARAELSPEAYRQRQQAAPEAIEIRVRSVKTAESRRANHTLVTHSVEAVVEKVKRTATDLKPGRKITIVYTQRRHDRPLAGPSEVPNLKHGQVCPAYLAWSKEAEAYSPAAGGFSFKRVGR